MKPNNLFLIGYRCTGKTSVGRCLADKLGWSFVDTDYLIVEKQQMSIKEIIGAYGWDKFRQMEREVLKVVCASTLQVVATGGGIILNEQNVTLMRQSGISIWLRASYETIKSRMLQDKETMDFRPALTSNDSLSEIEETLHLRDPLYQKAMDISIDTDGHKISEVANILAEKIESICPTIFEPSRKDWETK